MKITPEAVKERIAALESAGELSLKEQFYLEALRQLVAAMDSEPVADVVAWSHPTEERTCDIRWRRHDVEPGPLYRHAQPAPETEREPIAWLNDAYLARGVVDGEAGSEDAGPGYIPVYREASPAQPAPVIPDSCTWHCEEDINNWHSDCGYQFQFMEDGPEENGVKFCPKCGKSVAVSATEGTGE